MTWYVWFTVHTLRCNKGEFGLLLLPPFPRYLHPRYIVGCRNSPPHSFTPGGTSSNKYLYYNQNNPVLRLCEFFPKVGFGTFGLLKAPEGYLFRADPPTHPPFPDLFTERWLAKRGKPCKSTNKKPCWTIFSQSLHLISLRPTPSHAAHLPVSRAGSFWWSREAWVRTQTLIFDKFEFKFWHYFSVVTWWHRATYIHWLCKP